MEAENLNNEIVVLRPTINELPEKNKRLQLFYLTDII